jgi:hypothetical protein
MSIPDCINQLNRLIDPKLSLEICNCKDKSYKFFDGESRRLFAEKHEEAEPLYKSIIQLPKCHYKSMILPKDSLVYVAFTPILQDGLFNIEDKIHINTYEFITTYYSRKTVLDDIDTGDPSKKLFEIYIIKNTEIYYNTSSKDKNIVLPNNSVFKILNCKILPFYGSSCICYRVLLCVKQTLI